VVCACAAGFIGPNCRQCADGYSADAEGGCVLEPVSACAAIPGRTPAEVQAPVLRATLPASWDENWLAAPGVADLDGDGQLEVIAARHSVLYAWDTDGSLLWRAAWGKSASDPDDHGSTRMWSSPVIADFDNDGDVEIAVGSGASDGNVAVYDHQGMLLSGWPQHFGGSDEIRAITAGDLDGDGYFEVVVNKTNRGPATAVFALSGELRLGWPQVGEGCDPEPPAEGCWDFGGYNQNIGLADFDADGKLDVISTYDAIGFGIFHGDGSPFPTHSSFSDRVVTAVEAYHDLALSQQGWGNGDRSEFTYSPPAMGDVDGDGLPELLLIGDHEHSESTANRGSSFWLLRPDLQRPVGWESPKDSGPSISYDGELGANIVHTQPQPSMAQLDDDPALELIGPAYDGYVYVYDYSGELEWRYRYDAEGEPYTGASEVLVADLNGDGVPELLFNTWSSGAPREADAPAHLLILSNTGELLQQVELAGRGSMAAPTLADLEGDGELELIISLKDTLGGGEGGVQIWELPGAGVNCLLWPTARGNQLRQGRASR
jgi:hypothetical protein